MGSVLDHFLVCVDDPRAAREAALAAGGTACKVYAGRTQVSTSNAPTSSAKCVCVADSSACGLVQRLTGCTHGVDEMRLLGSCDMCFVTQCAGHEGYLDQWWNLACA